MWTGGGRETRGAETLVLGAHSIGKPTAIETVEEWLRDRESRWTKRNKTTRAEDPTEGIRREAREEIGLGASQL